MYFAAVWLGCSGPDSDDESTPEPTDDTEDTDTDDTGDTDTDPIEEPAQVSCALSENALVVSCQVVLPEAGPATLTLSAPDLPTRTFEVTDSLTEHQIWGWGLRPETVYDWSVAGQQGTISTGSLPPVLQTAEVEVTGELFAIDAVFVYLACGYFAMIDGEGEIIWAQPTNVYDALPDGMLWSPETLSVLAVADSTMSFDQSVFAETHISNTLLRRLLPGDFQSDLTHDVGRWGPYTYLLGEDNGIGGFEVFEGDVRIGSVSLSDYYEGVQGLNMAHVNGLVISEDGVAVMSLHGFDSAIGIDADPNSATFGELLWMAQGAPGGGQDLPDPDFLPAEEIAFQRQHNASLHGDSLWVFDNMSQDQSRALHLALDEESGLMIEQESWSMGRICTAQGGAIPIEGGVLATCATSGEVHAFREGEGAPSWSMQAICGQDGPWGSMANSTRGFPVTVR